MTRFSMIRSLCSLAFAALLSLGTAGLADAQSGASSAGTAQTPQDQAQEDGTPSLDPSLTVGYPNADFNYAGADSTSAYDFDESLASAMLGWENGSLMLSYGTREASDSTGASGTRPDLTTAGASLWTGGNAYIFRNLLRLPLAVYVPIRLTGKYRYVSLEDPGENGGDSGNPSSEDDGRPPLHLVGAGLGAGAGARATLPVGPDFIRDNLVGQASLVFAPGLMGNVGEGFDRDAFNQAPSEISPLDELKLRWATNLNIEVQFKRLLSSSVGVTAGYTLRTVSRSPEKPDGFGDVVDVFVNRDDFVEVTDQHVLRVGITW